MTCPDGLDRIDIRGISAFGHHGVLDHERENGQEFVVDVSLGLDLEPAAQTDDLASTVDYGVLSEAIHDVLTAAPVLLIEVLARHVVDLCLNYPRVQWVSATVHKPAAPITVPFTDVSVTLERRK